MSTPKATIQTFDAGSFPAMCRKLARRDAALSNVIKKHGLPPMWTRPPQFSTLIHIILEQQVSLASAYAAFDRLRQYMGIITEEHLLRLTDEELRASYFSRQKMKYARELATSINEKKLTLAHLHHYSDEDVISHLTAVKGIGAWTADIYLMMALQRTDRFPLGDIALLNSMRKVKQLPAATKEELLEVAEAWRPYRTIAAMILWHAYICERGIKVPG